MLKSEALAGLDLVLYALNDHAILHILQKTTSAASTV